MREKLIFVVLLLINFSATNAAPDEDLIQSLPRLAEPMRSKQYAGYLSISDTKKLFYWYIESENNATTDPVVLWLNGGPGCASMEGLFIEMGPYRVEDRGATVVRNPWTWNRIANIIYLDAPAGVGLSYLNSTNLTYTDDMVADDNKAALQLWFKKFPERKSNDFFVMGESYGGTYVPTLSSRIVKDTDNFPNFKGMLIGNGCMDYRSNYNTAIWYQYYHGFLDETLFDSFITKCCNGTTDCDFYALSDKGGDCGNLADDISETIDYSGIDPYFLYFSCYLDGSSMASGTMSAQVRMHHERQYMLKKKNYKKHMQLSADPSCAHHDDHIYYLNTPDVRAALRIPSYIQNYSMCSYAIGESYQRQYTTMKPFVTSVIEANKRVAFFNGDADSVCNVAGNSQFLKDLGRKLISPATGYTDENQLPDVIGMLTQYDGVSLVTVKGGGHFPAASFQKPKETFQVFQNFVKNQNFSYMVTADKQYVVQGASQSLVYLVIVQVLIAFVLY